MLIYQWLFWSPRSAGLRHDVMALPPEPRVSLQRGTRAAVDRHAWTLDGYHPLSGHLVKNPYFRNGIHSYKKSSVSLGGPFFIAEVTSASSGLQRYKRFFRFEDPFSGPAGNG